MAGISSASSSPAPDQRRQQQPRRLGRETGVGEDVRQPAHDRVAGERLHAEQHRHEPAEPGPTGPDHRVRGHRYERTGRPAPQQQHRHGGQQRQSRPGGQSTSPRPEDVGQRHQARRRHWPLPAIMATVCESPVTTEAVREVPLHQSTAAGCSTPRCRPGRPRWPEEDHRRGGEGRQLPGHPSRPRAVSSSVVGCRRRC